MKTIPLPPRLGQILLVAAGVGLFGYFLFHTIEGDRGLLSMFHLQDEVNVAQGRLDGLQKQRSALEHRVKLMQPDNLDPDLLDEESRKMLGYSKPNEIVVLTPEPKNSDKSSK
jgi:cell division protein FtsB